jgi:hypothetical protein
MIEKKMYVSDGVLKAVVKQRLYRVFDNNSSFILIMKEIKCHYQIILQLEFHLFRGINKKNEDLSDLLRLIYDDAKKNIIGIKLCLNGSLKCSIKF